MWLRNGLQCGTNELEVNHTASWLHGQSVRENTRSAWTIQWGRVHGYKMDFSPLSANWLERDVVSCHLSSFRYMIKDNSFCRSGFYSFLHYIFCSRKIHLKKKNNGKTRCASSVFWQAKSLNSMFWYSAMTDTIVPVNWGYSRGIGIRWS